MSEPVAGSDVESVCVGCGLCCDGTVVGHLAVRDESDLGLPLLTLGAEVIPIADPPVFALPCPAVVDGVCTVHHLHRPSACAQFHCALSRSVLEGRVEAARAREVVASTLDLRRRVQAGEAEPAELDARLDAWFRVGVEHGRDEP